VHLIENEIHDINPEISILISGRSTKVGMIEQVDQGGPNGIIVTSTWSNSVPEQALQLIIEREQPGDSAHLPDGSVELNGVEKLSTKRTRIIKRKPKASAKSRKVVVH
jgi:hypothetical protein